MWLSRPEAERSLDYVQPIPCTLISNGHGLYLVLKRIAAARTDLKNKFSLVVGGHIDRPRSISSDFMTLIIDALRVELDEELGLPLTNLPKALGLVVDSISVTASRHVGILFRTIASSHFVVRAPEEFITLGVSQQFLTPSQIVSLRDSLDPWSKIVVDEHITALTLEPPKANH